LSFVLSRKEQGGALQNSESIFILPVWFCWCHLFYIPKS
jgi:hypothetical protein